MAIKFIKDPAFTMTITESKLAEILEQYNGVKDEVLEPGDILHGSGISPENQIKAMREILVHAFQQVSYFKTDAQKEAMLRFFDVATKARELAEYVPDLYKYGTTRRIEGDKRDGDKVELDLDHDSYCKGYTPYLKYAGSVKSIADGVLSILLLAGYQFPEAPEIMPKMEVCEGPWMTGFIYNENALPGSLRAPVRDVVRRYMASAAILLRYDSIACVDSDAEDKENASYGRTDISDLYKLERIEAGTQNQILTKYSSTPCNWDEIYM